MRWLTRSIIPTMVALAALVAFFPRSGPTITVRALDRRFAPAELVVHVGDSITVENDGKLAHTFTCPRCEVDTKNLGPSQEKVVRFFKPGTFGYVCRYHEEDGMAGRVIVLREGEATPQASPSEQAPPGTP